MLLGGTLDVVRCSKARSTVPGISIVHYSWAQCNAVQFIIASAIVLWSY